jgi:hypothetical protein
MSTSGLVYHEVKPENWFERFDGVFDPDAFIKHARKLQTIPYAELTREQYETLCTEWGVLPVGDEELGDYGDIYGHWFMSHYLTEPANRQIGAERTLRQRRWWAVKKMKLPQVPVPVAVPVQRHVWGSNGLRYDEQCDRCRRETTVDNDTGVCSQCS